jgi:2-oxoisovalerate dehydrogenase E2 component (dihydrolipoyl transacylase)
MSLHVIKVPDVGEGIAEVELVEWHVKPGDRVEEDQVLASVMTDKASVDIPSSVAGTVVALGGEVGKMLAVGSELVRIDKGGAAGGSAEAAGPLPAAPPASAAVVAPAPAPAAKAAERPDGAPRAAPPDRPIASPAVRRRAWELGIDLKDVKATGTAGRVMHADLDAAVAAGVVRHPRAAGSSPSAAARHDDAVTTHPVIGLRRAIATRMQEAKRRIPHFSYVEELDVTDVESLRSALNEQWAIARGRLTLLPLLMRAVVLALRDFPQINALFDDDAGVISRHAAVHLGIATQTPNGLMVPVVKHAQTLDLWAMAAEVSRLADVARAGRATRDELTGSTITITSLGARGGIVTTPVINRPEVAIIGVNRIVEKPVVRNGAVVVRKTMNLSSSFDHRVVDGDDAARFIQAVRALLETPALLFVE